MKKTLLTLLLAWVAATAAVQAQSFRLGYCNGEVGTSTTWGGSGNGNTSAAIFVPAATLQGMSGAQIEAVSVGLTTRLNIDELTVWVRTSLNGSNVAEGVLNRKNTRVQQGWNEVALAAPYTIGTDAEGLYIGYTYHHTSLANAVSVVGTTPAGTAFFKKDDTSQWQDLSLEGAISIEAVVAGGSLAQHDLSLSSIALTPYLSAGATAYKATATVQNLGTSDESGFSVAITAGDIEATAHVAEPVASGRQAVVSFVFTASGAIDRSASVTATITALDGAADENPQNNTAQGLLSFERNVLLEEFTTELCPNCPTGAETMRTALALRPELAQRVAVVAHHSAFGTDWLTQPCDEDYTWMFNEDGQVYAPSWMIDRQGVFETNIVSGGKQAVYFTSDAKELAGVLEAVMQQPTHVVLGASTERNGNTLSVTVNALRDEAYSLADGRLTVYLIEDGIAAHSQEGLNGVVQGYIHEHVIRAYNSSWGDAIDWQGAAFTTTLQFDLDPAWNTEKMQVVAFVANYDSQNNLNCTVENTVSIPVVPKVDTGIRDNNRETISSNRIVYDLSGRRAAGATHGLRIVGGKKMLK